MRVARYVVRALAGVIACAAALPAAAGSRGDTPGVVQAALDHYVERKCRSSWATARTLVSDVAVKASFGPGHSRASTVGVVTFT